MQHKFTGLYELTARELIDILETVPGNSPICLPTPNDWDCMPAQMVETDTATTDGHYWTLDPQHTPDHRTTVIIS